MKLELTSEELAKWGASLIWFTMTENGLIPGSPDDLFEALKKDIEGGAIQNAIEAFNEYINY